MILLRYMLTLLILSGICGLLSGCWDLVEINRTSLVTGLAIEPGKKAKERVTFEVLNTAEAQTIEAGKGGTPTTLYTFEGNSLAETTGKLNELVDRVLIASHIRVIIIDEHIARDGLNKYIDVLQRSRFLREDVTILIARHVPASQLLQVLPPGGMYASYKIQSQVENLFTVSGGIPKSRLVDITQATLSDGIELALGAISIQGNSEESQTMDSIKSLKPKAITKISGAAVFQGDKLLGFLPVEETRMLNLVRNELKATVVTVPLDKKGRFASLRYQHRHTSLEVSMQDKEPLIKLHISGKFQITSIDDNLPLDKVEGYLELERLATDFLSKQVKASIKRVQSDFGQDIFGFGQHYYRYHNREAKPIMKEWNTLFSQAKVEVTTSAPISRSELKTRRLVK
ncbi:MAG: Ger(x)C family spore germination protein [Candidatus Pristimantibacillus sp.]